MGENYYEAQSFPTDHTNYSNSLMIHTCGWKSKPHATKNIDGNIFLYKVLRLKL